MSPWRHPVRAANLSVFSGYVVLTPTAGGKAYNVPSVGLNWDYFGVDPLSIREYSRCNYDSSSAFIPVNWQGRVVSMRDTNHPAMNVIFCHAARRLEVKLYTANNT